MTKHGASTGGPPSDPASTARHRDGRAGQRRDDALLTGHVVRGRGELADGRAAQDDRAGGAVDAVGEVGPARADRAEACTGATRVVEPLGQPGPDDSGSAPGYLTDRGRGLPRTR